MRIADSLDKYLRDTKAISLHRIEVRHCLAVECSRQAEGSWRQFTEVINAAKVDGEVGLYRYVIDVRAEFDGVPRDIPRKIVGELIPLFGTANKAERFPAEKSEARNVDSNVSSFWIGRKVIKQSTSRVLKPCFVELCRGDGPNMLRGYAGIPEGLLRSTGICILTEIFRGALRIHLDARHRAGAGAPT